MTYSVRSLAQNAGEAAGVEMTHYNGPTGGAGLSMGHRTSQEGAGNFENTGTSFTSRGLFGHRIAGMSAVNRGTLVNWDAGSSSPGFVQK